MKQQSTSAGVPTHESLGEQMSETQLVHKERKFSMPELPKTKKGRFSMVMVPATAASILSGVMMSRPWDEVFGSFAVICIVIDLVAIGAWIAEGD